MEKDIIGLRIDAYDSLTKCIRIPRKYEPISMGALKTEL